jgi:hypothetical protein
VIKLAIKLAIVALIANATWRVGGAYATHYRFTDAVQATTQFRGQKTDEQIRGRILELASQYDIPVTDDSVTVRRTADSHTIVDGAYAKPIDLVPGLTYHWPFTFHIDTFAFGPLK